MLERLAAEEKTGYQKKAQYIPVGANHGTIAKILKDPKKLSALVNSYFHYKVMGGNKRPAFLDYKQTKREGINELAVHLDSALCEDTLGRDAKPEAMQASASSPAAWGERS